MSSLRKRKPNDECRAFKERRITNYYYIQSKDKTLYLICIKTISVFKEYNIKRHYVTKHKEKFDVLEGHLQENKIEVLNKSLDNQQNIFKKNAKKKIWQ